MVGDGAGDRLADPPRRVRAELVAAAVLVLVDRAHQARVAFLDDVQERQAAVAVLLGDRDDQAQVAAGELALGVFVLVVDLADLHDALVQVLGVLQHEVFQARQLFLADFQVFAGVLDLLQLFDPLLELDHLRGDARELLHQRRDLARAERELFEQLHAAAAAAADRAGAARPAPSCSCSAAARPTRRGCARASRGPLPGSSGCAGRSCPCRPGPRRC